MVELEDKKQEEEGMDEVEEERGGGRRRGGDGGGRRREELKVGIVEEEQRVGRLKMMAFFERENVEDKGILRRKDRHFKIENDVRGLKQEKYGQRVFTPLTFFQVVG